jgi:hypothetical protein
MLVGAFILFMVHLLISVPGISDEEILECVGYEWKTTLQITAMLNKIHSSKSGKPGSIPAARVRTRLKKLTVNGFLESRDKVLTEEQLSNRGNRPDVEFRRTGKKKPVTKKESPRLKFVEA